MTQQPADGGPEAGAGQQGDPAYPQPQDPWIGYDPGLASMPTDPIPQRHEAYPAGVPSDVWNNLTAPQGAPEQFPYPQPPKRNNAAVISIVVVVVLALGGGGAYAAYKYFSGRPVTGTGPASSTTTTTTHNPRSDFPYTVKVGDCVINVGTEQKPKMAPSECTARGSYTVVKIATGRTIPVGPRDTFDTDTTSAQVCAGIDFDTWYGYQVDDPDLNLFFCMKDN